MPDAAAPPCPVVPLEAGQTYVGRIVCTEQRFGASGEGTLSDTWMANSRARFVLRHPEASLTLAGLSGGTLIDAAPWGRGDLIHEIAPLVDGGWLVVDDADISDDAYTLSGTIRSLPERPSPSAGARATVTWRILPDDPWLHLEGADGLWIHPAIAMERLDGWLVSSRGVIGHDGVVEADLGGAVRVRGATRLLVADPVDAWAARDVPLQRIAGLATHASEVVFFRGDRRIGLWPVNEDGTFEGWMPADIDGVQAFGSGFAPSARTRPGEDLDLSLAFAGALRLRAAWEPSAVRRPIQVTWTGPEGTGDTLVLPPDGGLVPTGPGPIGVEVSAGPGFAPRTGGTDILPGQVADLAVTMRSVVDTNRFVAASMSFAGSRARTQRIPSVDRSRQAIGAGYTWLVSTALDDIDTAAIYLNDGPHLRWEDGGAFPSPEGWTLTAWPWRATPSRSGHGAPRLDGLSAERALDVIWGGPAVDRTVMANLAWFDALTTSPLELSTTPDWIDLSSPGTPPFEAWTSWFAWLDARRFVRPAGPVVWLDIGDAADLDPVPLSLALTYGRSSAGTGARAEVRVNDALPGDVLPPTVLPEDTDGTGDTDPPPARTVRIRVERGNQPINRASLVEGGEVVETFVVWNGDWSWEGLRPPATWTTVIGWSTTTDDWVVSTPIWDTPTEAR